MLLGWAVEPWCCGRVVLLLCRCGVELERWCVAVFFCSVELLCCCGVSMLLCCGVIVVCCGFVVV